MGEKMLVTQALDERDLLVKKIADKIAKASFVDTIKPNEEKVYAKRISKEEYASSYLTDINIDGKLTIAEVLLGKLKLD